MRENRSGARCKSLVQSGRKGEVAVGSLLYPIIIPSQTSDNVYSCRTVWASSHFLKANYLLSPHSRQLNNCLSLRTCFLSKRLTNCKKIEYTHKQSGSLQSPDSDSAVIYKVFFPVTVKFHKISNVLNWSFIYGQSIHGFFMISSIKSTAHLVHIFAKTDL